ncbi:hypothetical protein E2562_029008 [Oryza meyeriana var. granulata]|uniref:Uncharacterized protein n=1 Tax=Oryza meyeriana var. granulata TaxID=110450 RepID=A0A6G1E3E6_9ORYZ|nr:hypothetical protein E2562_029008 [Oryza meyeriana var. granulata]
MGAAPVAVPGAAVDGKRRTESPRPSGSPVAELEKRCSTKMNYSSKNSMELGCSEVGVFG